MVRNGDIKLRIWWIRNPPNEPTYHEVASVEEGLICLQRLADRDLHSDSVSLNAGGLEIFENNEWTEWYDSDGRDAWAIMKDNEDAE